MRKHLLSLLMSIILTLTVIPVAALADDEPDSATSNNIIEIYNSSGEYITSADTSLLQLSADSEYLTYATAGYTYKLLEDVTISSLASVYNYYSYGISLAADTLDLNGHTITISDSNVSGTYIGGIFIADVSGSQYQPIIKNGTIIIDFNKPSGDSDYTYAILAQVDPAMIFENLNVVVTQGNSVDGMIYNMKTGSTDGTKSQYFKNCVISVGTDTTLVADQIHDTAVYSGTYSTLVNGNSGSSSPVVTIAPNSTVISGITSASETSKSALDDVDGTVIVSSDTAMIIVADPPGATAAPEVKAQSISLMSGGSGGKVAYTYDSVAAASEALGSGAVSNTDGTGVGVYTVNHDNDGDNDGTNILLTQAETVDVGGSTYFVADEIEVEFVETSDANVYKINLVGADGTAIYRFLAAQLEFELTTDNAIGYEIAAADGISMTESGGVYEFNLTDSKAAETAASGENAGITDTSVTIGTVTFTGEGTFDFGIKSDDSDDTNKVQTAVYSSEDNNIVRTYVPDDTATTDVLDVSSGLENITISLEKSTLTVNVAFPNTVIDQTTNYTDMSVKVTGLNVDKTLAFGATDDTGTSTNQRTDSINIGYSSTDTLTEKTYLSDYSGYKVEVEVYQDYAYQLEFSGAGYRTYRTTIIPTDDEATVTVWNNAMSDEMVVVSKSAADSAVYETTTFLAGEICQNGVIDLYDLSAVVSYFGKTDIDDDNYIKYDLNRDGKIDSKDIAMVLVSWGK